MVDHWLTTFRWAPSGPSSQATTAGSTPATAASSSRHPSSSSKAAETSEWQTVKTSGPRPKGRRPGAEQADGPGPGATPGYASASPLDFQEPWRDDAGPSDDHSGPAPARQRPQQRPVVMPAVSEDELPEDWEEAASAADSAEKDEAAALAAVPADEVGEAALAADTSNDEGGAAALAAVTAAEHAEEAASAVDFAEEGTLTANPTGEVGQAAWTAGTSNDEGAAAALTTTTGRHAEAAPAVVKAAATTGVADRAAHAADAQDDIGAAASSPAALLSASAQHHASSHGAEAGDDEQCGGAAPLSPGAAAAIAKAAEHLLDGSGTVEATDAVSESLQDSTRLHSAAASGHSGVAFEAAAELPSLSQAPGTSVPDEHMEAGHDSTLSGHATAMSVPAELCCSEQNAATDSMPERLQHLQCLSDDAIVCQGHMGQEEQQAVALEQTLNGEAAHLASHSDLAGSPHQLDEDIVWKQVR